MKLKISLLHFPIQSSTHLHNSTMSNGSFRTESFGRSEQSLLNMSSSIASDRPSFSSLFTAGESSSQPLIDAFSPPGNCSSSGGTFSADDDGVYLQISNLDQWYDESNLRNYLMNQLKPITPILSLSIETPSIAKVKVPSTQVT